MDWQNILGAVLAGGLAGQITTVLLGQIMHSRRDQENWLRTELFRVYAELLDSVSGYASRTQFDEWPDEIRVLSVRVHLLTKGGTAPQVLSDAMQQAFNLALDRKLGKVKYEKGWRYKFRDTSRDIRTKKPKGQVFILDII